MFMIYIAHDILEGEMFRIRVLEKLKKTSYVQCGFLSCRLVR
jgi:hypothetical protein